MKKTIMVFIYYIAILIQIINLYSVFLETGTQGSIDGYLMSVFFGLIFCILIALLDIKLKEHKKSILILLIIFSQVLVLLGLHFPYIEYVFFQNYKINDVITDVIKLGLATKKINYFESLLVLLIYIYVLMIGLICIKGITKYIIIRNKLKKKQEDTKMIF